MACPGVATATAKAATATNLSIDFLPCFGFTFWFCALIMPCTGRHTLTQINRAAA
jgi:hypothetical protein